MAYSVSVRVPTAGPYPTGIHVNNGAGYAASTTTALTVDDVYASAGCDATIVFKVGRTVMAFDNSKVVPQLLPLGVITAVTATTVRIANGGGTRFAVADNLELFIDDASTVALIKGNDLIIAGGDALSPSASLEVSDDGRGQLIFTYFSFA